MSLSKEQTEELKLCMLQLKVLDIEAYDEIESSKDKKEEVWNLLSEVIVAEDKLSSTFDDTKEGKEAFDKSVKSIIEALDFETFHVEILQLESKEGLVTFTRDGTTFLPEIHLLTVHDTENATSKQAASIIIEIDVVILSIIKVEDPLSKERLKKVIQELEPYMSKISDALQILAFTWKNNSDNLTRAVSLITFLKQIFNDGVLYKSIKLIIANMGNLKRIKVLTRLALFFKRTCGNPKGIKKQIEEVLKTKGAEKLKKKIVNLIKISEFRATLDPSYIL